MKSLIPSSASSTGATLTVERDPLLAIAAISVVAMAIAGVVGIARLPDRPAGTADVGVRVGPGYVDSFNVSCGTTATLIQATCGQVSYSAEVDSGAAAAVYFGDSDVTTTIYGESHAASERIGGNVRHEYCIVASGTVTIHVRALCSSAP